MTMFHAPILQGSKINNIIPKFGCYHQNQQKGTETGYHTELLIGTRKQTIHNLGKYWKVGQLQNSNILMQKIITITIFVSFKQLIVNIK